MPRLLVVHHTPSPALQEMFEAAVSGARTDEIEDVEVAIRPALTAAAADVLEADGYLLGTPANIGYMSGALKHFFDGIYYPCLEATRRRPYGLYVHGASDTGGAVRAVESITTGLRWRQIRPPVTVTGPPGKQDLEACWELGALLAERRRGAGGGIGNAHDPAGLGGDAGEPGGHSRSGQLGPDQLARRAAGQSGRSYLVPERVQQPRHREPAATRPVLDLQDLVIPAQLHLLAGIGHVQRRVQGNTEDHPPSSPATFAASSAPRSQHACRSALAGGPTTVTAGRTACQPRPPAIDSTARTAPEVSLAPCT